MATSRVLNILSKVEPLPELNLAKVEQGVAASRPKDSPRHIELAEAQELEQLEAASRALFEPQGESWDDIARKHRARVKELSEAIKQVKDAQPGRMSDSVQRKIARAETELEGLVRRLGNAERAAAATVAARAEFESDGRLARLKELRQKSALRRRDPLEVLSTAVTTARITAKATRL